MSWIEETIERMQDKPNGTNKAEVKEAIANAAHEFLAMGYDWDDVEITMVALLRPLAGELIILLQKWLREVRDEEREAPVN